MWLRLSCGMCKPILSIAALLSMVVLSMVAEQGVLVKFCSMVNFVQGVLVKFCSIMLVAATS